MHHVQVLIVGCGGVGTALGLQLLDAGYSVSGVRRTINQLPQGIHGIAADLHQPDTLAGLPAADYVVYCAAASEHSEAGYRATYIDGLKATLAALPQPPKQLFFTSSTGVYHQHNHEWVDEQSECQPGRFSGQVMLEAEQLALNSGIA
ncbi:MAG: NAD-dependent epimerase/dehydratase family protein, partial [Porticoccaceae bacterium]|nr:NAD-dependent epimerase/dehydratase family protein [Porticoccaceae bacterium]